MKHRTVSCKTTLATICSLFLALGLLAGCSGGSGTTPTKGTLKVAITDKQSDDYAEVVIAIREIRVVPAGRDNAADDDPALPVLVHYATPQVIDVMKLQFIQQALGEIILPAGSYSQIRLILEPNGPGQPVNYLTLKSDPTTKIALKTPSGQQSGLKVLGPVEVKPGIINAVLIDFDPNTAIVERGNTPQSEKYLLKPTGIRLVQTSAELTQFGSISGTVLSVFKDWSSATVSVKRRGAVNDLTPIAAGRIFSAYTSGHWQAPFAAFVPPNAQNVTYRTFITTNGFRLYSSPAVTVTQGETTSIGGVTLTPLP
jgi:hypothetical protein